MTARKQELSKQLQDLLGEGQRLATVLRRAVAVHYGPRAEKLSEFRIQPFRGRVRKAKPSELPEAPKPPAPTPFFQLGKRFSRPIHPLGVPASCRPEVSNAREAYAFVAPEGRLVPG